MSTDLFFVTVDKDAFRANVSRYMDLSPVTKEWGDVRKLKWPSALLPPQLWNTLKELTDVISVIVSAVELAKQKIIKEQDPDGSKGARFDREIALGTAVKILASLVRFEGIVGSLVNRLWLPLLNVLVSLYVNQLPKGDWVSIALAVLKLVEY